MRRVFILIFAVLFLTVCAGSSIAGETSGATHKAKDAKSAAASTTPSNEFTKSRAWKKVGENLQQAYLAALKTNFASDERLTCFVKANEQLMDGDRSFLNSNGFAVQMISGFTARGQMAMKDLPNVANLPFVQKINTGK